ncbi:P-loop containing nucleoside triphosphate hydrolase protein [Mycena haematopus]|nr:P-loop containing nucleoside triphosphate hydrolase protein [Mycena haematopus]
MSDQPFAIVQDIFKVPHPAILVTSYPLASLTPSILQDFLSGAEDGILGVAPAYGTNCVLSVLGFATGSNVLLVRFTKGKAKAKAKQPNEQGRKSLEDLLLSASRPKFAFNMDVLATSLQFDLGLRIRSAVDLLSLSSDDRQSLQALTTSLGGEVLLDKANVASLFKGEEKLSKTPLKEVALQAWVAWRAATLDNMNVRLNNIPRIDTSSFRETRLSVFAKMVRDVQRLSALKPTVVRNEISNDYSTKKGRLHVTCTRFKSRVQRDSRTVEIQFTHQGQQQNISSKPTSVQGRAVKLNLAKPLPPGSITRVTTIGREPLTSAEAQCADIILRALKKTSAIADKPFFQAIWLPQETPTWSTAVPFAHAVPIRFSRELNDSQKMAVSAIVSNDRINVIQGPPGSGKTTVIAAVVASISSSGIRAQDKSIWLIAQSNVAVKNIAEKLASVDFLDFKLIVSKEFHFDWHEHLYEKINPNLIRSDKLTDDIVAIDRRLLGSKVILCTLSMLSNPRISAVTHIVPIQTVIVDEASQVQIGDYLPMVSLFSTTLRKLVFIGDDKQCDMPTQLGNFISKRVYNNQLKTVHSDETQCCHFVDVKGSKEVPGSGSSWNEAEVRAAIREARKCENAGRSYRIITPYDAQRNKIEAALKSEKMAWEDKVFCVDSFQGNEADYIIISVVRTKKIGFLAEKRRGMKIFTSRAFVEGVAKNTLVGLLASDIGPGAWEA